MIGKLWKILPRAMRLRIVRTTQTTFTISVAAIVINERRQVLLLNHVLRPRSGWGIPGGFLDAREQAFDAIRREIKEETGMGLENLQLRHIIVRGRHLEIVFSARPSGEPRVLSSEIYELGWFGVDSLPEGLVFSQKKLISEVLNSEI